MLELVALVAVATAIACFVLLAAVFSLLMLGLRCLLWFVLLPLKLVAWALMLPLLVAKGALGVLGSLFGLVAGFFLLAVGVAVFAVIIPLLPLVVLGLGLWAVMVLLRPPTTAVRQM